RPPIKIFRGSLPPEGMASRTVNFEEWSSYLVGQLLRAAALSGDAEFGRLVEEVMEYPNVAAARDWRRGAVNEEPQVVVPLRLIAGATELALFTTVTVFGTPQGITLSELAVRLFFRGDRPPNPPPRGRQRNTV